MVGCPPRPRIRRYGEVLAIARKSQPVQPRVRVLAQDYEMVGIESVKPHPKNPRQGDVGAISESIEANGFYGAIVVQRSTGYVLAGNHRLMAARAQGLSEVPCVWIDVDDERAVKILLADNRTNDLASYNDSVLAELLADLANTSDLTGTGYDGDDLDALIAEMARGGPEQEVPDAKLDQAAELQKKWGTESGQLWIIGNHRLLCGDSTNQEDVARLLDGNRPNLMVTDPPYGVNYDPNWRNEAAEAGHLAYSARRVREVANDDRVDWRDAWALFPGNVLYTWSPGGDHVILTGLAIQESGFTIRNQIIWKKPHFPISRGAYTYQHEPCWYAVRKGEKADFIGPKNESSVWEITLDKNVEGGHSTQKPLECMARPIRNHTGDVYEPFCGSGTTICAAEGLGRKCYAMEIDPGYIAVTLERLSQMGLEPRLVDGTQ